MMANRHSELASLRQRQVSESHWSETLKRVQGDVKILCYAQLVIPAEAGIHRPFDSHFDFAQCISSGTIKGAQPVISKCDAKHRLRNLLYFHGFLIASLCQNDLGFLCVISNVGKKSNRLSYPQFSMTWSYRNTNFFTNSFPNSSLIILMILVFPKLNSSRNTEEESDT